MRKNDSITSGGRTIAYEIVYSKRRKKAAIVVRPDLKVEFRAPQGLSREAIRGMVSRKAEWVQKKLEWFEENRPPALERQYLDGESFLYLGREYPLKIIPEGKEKPVAAICGPELVLRLPAGSPAEFRPALAKEAVRQWYRQQAEVEVKGHLTTYSEKFGITPPAFKVKYQKRRWGSCSADNVLRINFQLMMAPPGQLEYVVVHELCHVKEKNHSLRFWKLVGELMPGYEVHRKELKKEGWRYVL